MADAIRQDHFGPNTETNEYGESSPSSEAPSDTETSAPIPQKILPCALLSIIVLLALSAFFLFLLFKFETHIDADQDFSHGLTLNLRAGILLLPSTLSSTIAICILPAMIHLYLQVQAQLPELKAANESVETLRGTQEQTQSQASGENFVGPKSTASTRRRDILRFVIHMGFMLVLCVVIVSSDIWLHTSTLSRQADVYRGPSGSPDAWGRDLTDGCMIDAVDKETNSSSELSQGTTRCLNTPPDEKEAVRTAQNTSAVNQIIFLQQGSAFMAILADKRATAYSYTAKSFSVSTKCTSVGAKCKILEHSLEFFCAENNTRGIFAHPVNLIPYASSYSNSFDFVAPVMLDANQNNSKIYKDDPNFIYSRRKESLLTVFSCQASVFRVQFAHARGHYRLKSVAPATFEEATNILSLAFPDTPGTASFSQDILASAIPAAALSSAGADALVAEFARAFSRTTISAAASGMLRPIPADESASPMQVTVVPKAAAYTLVAANVLYAVVSMLLSIAALLFSSMQTARKDRVAGERAEEARVAEANAASGMTSAMDRLVGKEDGEAKSIS